MNNKDLIIQGLEELSNESLQMRLWVNGTDEISSFEEATCYVFDDGGLSQAIDNGYVSRNFSDEFITVLFKLSKQIDKMPVFQGPEAVINHPSMPDLRELATRLLVLFKKECPDDFNEKGKAPIGR